MTPKKYNTLKNRKHISVPRKILAALLSGIYLYTSALDGVYAGMGNDILRQSIYEATFLLEDAINASMKNAEDAVKEKIVEKEYDYYTTMETFFRSDNPYADADYLELIAAYMVAMEHTDTLTASSFYGLPFVSSSVITTYSWEYVPVITDRYLENGDGTYCRSGKTYITEPQTIPTYEKNEDGSYIPSGTCDIEPEKKFTKYGDVKLKGIDAEGILTYYGLDADHLMNAVRNKKKRFEQIVNGNGLKQSMFLESRKTDLIDDFTRNYISSLLADEDMDLSRKYLIDTAVSLVGMVPYEWGGKASAAGYDTAWWTIDDTGRQKGLDCSGFVQWAFMTAGFEPSLYRKMISTDTILDNTETINASQLKPGDLGLINNGQRINHVGIFLGDGMWVHCSSAKNTVVVEKTGMFKIYKRMPDGEGTGYTKNPILTGNIHRNAGDADLPGSVQEEDEAKMQEQVNTYQDHCPFTDYEIYLTAQLVYNEAVGEGLNGWAAVAEIVLNRVNSEHFADTIEDVIFEDGQFSDSEWIKTREPSDEMITTVREVLSGNMKIFNSGDVLFFRNAGGSTENWGSHEYIDTINSHQFYKY